MAEGKIFVGRKAELEQFKEVLKDPKGQAVLVVGQAGMGKSWLVDKMTEIAENHPELKCGWVRYEVTPTDSPGSIMEIIIDHAFDAARVRAGLLDRTPKRAEQFRTFLNLFGNVGDFVKSFKRDTKRHIREQFLEKLNLISDWMPANGRAIFVIDPEKYMQDKSDQSWAIVVKNLPDNVKFVFAQRPGDALVESETIDELDNLVHIPEKRLGVLEKNAIDKLLKSRAKEVGYTAKQLDKALSLYNGHPYALGAALDLLEAGIGLEELPKKTKPTKFAEVQWRRVCGSGEGAIELFEAYAVLEVGVPDDVVEAVSGLKSSKRRKLLADKYLAGLLREEGEGKRIYHAILADYILGQTGEVTKKQYHSRAVDVYRGKLEKAEKEQIRPDALAATRLAEHVLAADGKVAFVKTCAYETYGPLTMLGLLDVALGLSKRALDMVRKGSKEEAAVRCTMGLVYRTKGDLDEAEKMHLRALEIEKEGQREVGMAREYGNLGLIYYTQGELDKAEDAFLKILKIHERLDDQEGKATDYGNLGLIYRRRGELDKAEEMQKKSLDISKKLGSLEGMARDYGNLGLIYKTKGDLDKAEEMYLKSLKIAEKLGFQEIMASDYGNLGSVYKQRGDIGKAREYWEKAVGLYKKIGIPHKVEKVQGLIEGMSK